MTTRRLKEDAARGERIAELMRERGALGDAEVADMLEARGSKANRSLVWGWRHGKGMTVDSLRDLAEVLQSTPSWIRIGSGVKHAELVSGVDADADEMARRALEDLEAADNEDERPARRRPRSV